MMDTVGLESQDHQSLELWEVEVNNREEVDLHLHVKNCTKNPNHANFIPIHQFSVDCLPPEYRDNDIVNFVQAMADLTVHLSVTYISMNRPETFPGSLMPYPFYDKRGSHARRTGTGWVDSVDICKESECHCQECLKSSEPKKQFAYILIKTAAHVIYDDQEGAHTICHLFFDKDVKPKPSNGAITLSPISRVRSNASIDFCELVCMTHDMDLADRMQKIVYTWRDLREDIHTNYDDDWTKEPRDHTLSIIVSHPHGCSKQVTIGKRIEEKSIDDGWSKITYNTATCPGSSGAHVFFIGMKWNWGVKFIHWGVCGEQTELNESNYMLMD